MEPVTIHLAPCEGLNGADLEVQIQGGDRIHFRVMYHGPEETELLYERDRTSNGTLDGRSWVERLRAWWRSILPARYGLDSEVPRFIHLGG